MEGKLEQRIVFAQGVPMNPFKAFEQDIAGIKMLETSVQVANRLKSIFSHVYKFGDQHANIFKVMILVRLLSE